MLAIESSTGSRERHSGMRTDTTKMGALRIPLEEAGLSLENGQSLLQPGDLGFAPGLALRVRLGLGDALVTQLGIVVHDGIQICLSALQIRRCLRHEFRQL